MRKDKKLLSTDERYMLRAMELAMLGQGSVSPNPVVGCVIVHDGKIIGEGWHQQFGEAHAEVNAVNEVEDKSLLKESTVYVTLEPCSHFGKTPPCADLLVSHRVKKVIIANLDSNPLVSGKGVKKLRDAGIEVVTGVLESIARKNNRRFFTFIEKQRPYIILKWAQTADGFIARENFDSKWISDEFSRQLVHKWRAEEDAVMMGSNTVLHDNPMMTVRDWTGRNPIRIVIDRFLKLPNTLHVFDRSVKTIFYNHSKDEIQDNFFWVKVAENNMIPEIIADLYKRKIQSVMIEGGAQIINQFVKADMWDEARVFYSPVTFQKGIASPVVPGESAASQRLKSDTLKFYFNQAKSENIS